MLTKNLLEATEENAGKKKVEQFLEITRAGSGHTPNSQNGETL